MQYVMLIHEKPGLLNDIADEQRQAIPGEYYAITSDPRVTPGVWMKPADAATTVRVNQCQLLVTDGPFADTKEVFGGYFARRTTSTRPSRSPPAYPQARFGGSVEIRPGVEQQR